MTTASPRGDIGNLALADAALGALLIDIAVLAAVAAYPYRPKKIKQDLTTRQAAQKVKEQAERDPDVFPESFDSWLNEVFEVADLRNQVIHAVAVNTCAECGNSSLYRHPRSGEHVDRTEEAVRAVTAQAEDLNRQGLTHAQAVAGRVNDRIMATARRTAEETDEIQNPPQVDAHRPVYICRDCQPYGRRNVTINLGAAVEVWPRDKLQMLKEQLARLHAERDYERWHR